MHIIMDLSPQIELWIFINRNMETYIRIRETKINHGALWTIYGDT